MNERFGGCGSVLNIHQHGIPHTNCISNTSSGDDATVDHNHLLHDETSPIWKDQDHSNNQNWYTYECLNGLFEEEAIEILQRFYEQGKYPSTFELKWLYARAFELYMVTPYYPNNGTSLRKSFCPSSQTETKRINFGDGT